MNSITFEQLIQTYGCQAQKWPQEYKQDMLNFIKNHPNCLNDFLVEIKLDNLLNRYSIPNPPQSLSEKILHCINSNHYFSFRSLFLPLSPKLSALSLALVLGFSMGAYEYSGEVENDYLLNAFSDTMIDNATNQNEISL